MTEEKKGPVKKKPVKKELKVKKAEEEGTEGKALKEEEEEELADDEDEEEEGEEKEDGKGKGKAKKGKGKGDEGGKDDKDKEKVEEYKAKPKPELTDEVKKALGLRNEMNATRIEFHRQEWTRYKRLGDAWRKPRGLHSKMRRHWNYRPDVVSIGYRGPKAARDLHPSGYKEVLVHNPKELENVDPKTTAVRIAHTVGTKKRKAIMERAADISKKKKVELRILNPLR